MTNDEREKIEFLNSQYLIPHKGEINPITLSDLMLVMAKNMEYSLQEAGATKEDYTILDLYNLAKPFAEEVFKTTKVEFNIE